MTIHQPKDQKRCVHLDRRIERMIQRFKDGTINLEYYLSGLNYLIHTYILDNLYYFCDFILLGKIMLSCRQTDTP